MNDPSKTIDGEKRAEYITRNARDPEWLTYGDQWPSKPVLAPVFHGPFSFEGTDRIGGMGPKVRLRTEPLSSAPPTSGTRIIPSASQATPDPKLYEALDSPGLRLRELEEKFAVLQRVTETIPGMVSYWDVNQRCRFANAAYKEWFGVGPAALIGRTLEELLGSSYSLNLPYIEAALRGEAQMFEREIPDPAGGPSRCSLAQYVPGVVNGAVQGFVVIVSDITMRRDLERELRRPRERAQMMASVDHLTGLPNQILFRDRVSCAIEGAKRNGVECSVLFLELHDFKKVNDTFGLGAGDGILREVGQRLSESSRASDTVSRIGDSDFVVLLPEIDAEQAGKVARKLLRAVAEEPLDVCDRTVRLSVSVGIAMYPGDGADSSELIARADSALYDAKRAGKDQIAYFASGRPSSGRPSSSRNTQRTGSELRPQS